MASSHTVISREHDLGPIRTTKHSVVESTAEKILELFEQDGFVCFLRQDTPNRTQYSFYCAHVNGAVSYTDPLTAKQLAGMLNHLAEVSKTPELSPVRKRSTRGPVWKVVPILTPGCAGMRISLTRM